MLFCMYTAQQTDIIHITSDRLGVVTIDSYYGIVDCIKLDLDSPKTKIFLA